MKRILYILAALLLLTVPVGAAQFALSKDVLWVNGIKIVGKPMYTYQNTNYLPLRAVAEVLGANVNYNRGRIDITPGKKYKAQDAVALADMANSVVLIHATRDGGVWKGSGFAVGSYIVTNEHVVRDAKYLECKNQTEDSFNALEVVKVDASLDVAILKLKDRANYPGLKLGDSEKVKFYGGVISISYANGTEQLDWEAGDILLQKKVIDGNEYIITNNKTYAGSSGGALLDENGEVIGVLKSSSGQYSYSIPINKVKTILGK